MVIAVLPVFPEPLISLSISCNCQWWGKPEDYHPLRLSSNYTNQQYSYIISNISSCIIITWSKNTVLVHKKCDLFIEVHYSQLITINSINTASTHEQSATGICYLQNSRTLPHRIVSRTDYQSVTTNLCRAGTSSSLWYLWGTSEYSAETEITCIYIQMAVMLKVYYITSHNE